ncbi:MAG: rhomboid family intramembrane serine protease [Flavobacteriales bacterium]
MFNNLPQVTKNLLLINVIVFVATFILSLQNIDLNGLLGSHYLGSPLFQPYQIITHMFAHGDFWHLFLNMWLFVMLGGFLEQLWGPKRFFYFFISCGLGAFFLYNIVGAYELYTLRETLTLGYNMESIDQIIKHAAPNEGNNDLSQYLTTKNYVLTQDLVRYVSLVNSTMLGASGAVFGVLAAFAILFPNQEFMLFFILPVKAKYLVTLYFVYELLASFENNPMDNVAHLAHVGGAIVGAGMVLYWRKKDRNHFY